MATYQMIHHVPTKINFIGFTLIEILFVIALIGVITAFSLSAYEKKSENTKIDKTALQIQQILQAATAYYNDNSCWPGNCSGSNIANFSDYLPFGENPKNPWGNAYHYQTLGPNGERFQVDTSVLTENIAKRVANKLPFSEVNDKTILTETVIPGATPENQSLIVKDIGSLKITNNASQSLPEFNCPNGYDGYAATSLQSVASNEWNPTGSLLGSYPIYQVGTNTSPILCNQSGDTYSCKMSAQFKSRWRDGNKPKLVEMPISGNVTAQYIEYCKRK